MTPEVSMGPAIAAPAVAPAASRTNPAPALIKIVADRFTVIASRARHAVAGDQ
jgi:hypothetical protein